MSKIFITSDLHFGHHRNFLYEPRGYNSIEEHDEDIISIWNETVSPDDIVYVLGDLMLKDNIQGIEKLKRLNGNKKIILGNHDSGARIELYKSLENTEVLGYAIPLKYNGYNLFLSHYPCIVSNYDADRPLKQRTINIAGHCHTKDKWKDFDKGLIYHIEWDSHGKPVWVDDIIEDIKNRIEGGG